MKIVKSSINKKAFTLVELIAVIVILGILTALVIPNVSRYIDHSKRETYKNSIYEFGKAVKLDETVSKLYSKGEVKTVLPLSSFPDKIKSLFGNVYSNTNYVDSDNIDDIRSYVVVMCSLKKCDTFIQVIDSEGYGIKLTNVEEINSINIEKYDLTNTNSNGIIYSNMIENLQLGDVDLNDDISSNDAAIIKGYINGNREISHLQKYFADINRNGSVDLCDAQYVSFKVNNLNYSVIYGDGNRDGVVDINDLNRYKGNSGLIKEFQEDEISDEILANADLNCDSVIDTSDYNILKDYLNNNIKILPQPAYGTFKDI